MGEDRTAMCSSEKKDCRQRHSSVISSSCSEDAESESTSAGYPASPAEEELEYGPGIVNKLRTRFLSITLKQTRGSNMRRSCSMENLLDQDRPSRTPVDMMKIDDEVDSAPARSFNLKRAKSMDTLLMEMNPDIVKGGTICDEELPKPDTVKTYKRMFEPAESRRGSHGRRPPVLRASARSSSSSKLVSSTNSSAKVNGTSRSKISAKQPPVKAQSLDQSNGKIKADRPLYNGCHIVKATPVKISNVRNNNVKEVDNLNSINRLLSKKEVHFAPKTDIICNGNGVDHQEILKIKPSEEVVKQFTKNPITNGNMKPKVPPNRPSLRSPKPLMKTSEQRLSDVISPTKSMKPVFANGLKKPCEINNKGEQPKSPVLKSPEPKSRDSLKIKDHIKSPPPVINSKNDFAWPPELKLKDKAPLPPLPECSVISENLLKSDDVLKIESTPEKTIQDRIQTLADSTAKNKAHAEEKDTISKITDRTASSSPEIKNSDKTYKAQLITTPRVVSPVKPVNGIVEPVKKSVNGFIDNAKKSISGSVLDKSNKLTTSPSSEKIFSNGICDSAKKPTNGNSDPANGTAKKTFNGTSDPVKPVPNNRLTNPTKYTSNGIGPINKPINGLPDTAKQTNGLDPVKKPANTIPDSVKPTSNGLDSPAKQTSNGLVSPTKQMSNGIPPETAKKSPKKPSEPAKKPVNGYTEPAKKPSNGYTETVKKGYTEPAKKPANGYTEPVKNGYTEPATDSPDIKRPIKKSQAPSTSMVFDFRGKDVVPNVAVLPTPFGCKSVPKKRSDDASTEEEDEDEDYVDYSVPPPSGVVFEGENIKVGRGSILATRNKDLKIKFDDEVDGNTFVYPSETSLLEEPERTLSSANEVTPNDQPPPQNSKLKTNTSIGSSSGGGLSTYTPSVLRTMDNFEPGMFRPPAPSPTEPQRGEEGEENEDLIPAGKEGISTWSLSAGTSDLLF